VTDVTAGASARRSTATVLADDLVEELAGLRDPAASAAAAVAGAGTSPEGQRAVADEAVEPDVIDTGNVQVVALNAHSPAPEQLAVNTVATDGHAGSAKDQADAAISTPDPVTPAPSADAPGPGRRPRRRERRGPTLREQRRQRTREAIVDAAAELFIERGFDHVSVMEIAQRAGVVEKTVFNHFPVKEGLVFEADPPMRAALLDAVRRRPAGESVAAAAGNFVVAAVSQLGSPAAAEGMAEMARVIRGSRTLQAREREILGMLTDTLAEQITLETRASAGELEPWLAANAVLGLYSALLELARNRVLAGASGPELVAELRTRGQRGLALLQFGLAGYAKRR
jgi:AcrR family transcriptional regulator